MSDRKPPVDAALDVLLYAPLGFALEARTLLPKLVERGRNQVSMAKVMGQFAVQQGQVEANKRLGPVQEQVRGQVGTVLADLGLAPRPARPAASGPDPAEGAAATVASTPAEAASPATAPDASVAETVPSGDLAIPDYDSLAASQVVPRLRALSEAELEDVRAYEAAGRGRKTILNRIAQLQNG
ncbi:MAG TPA: hypothetical protein VEW93_07740 [Acidimicrobiales bacterium]|nr:hypothetical protein [Acidimicrobiales bacterium]